MSIKNFIVARLKATTSTKQTAAEKTKKTKFGELYVSDDNGCSFQFNLSDPLFFWPVVKLLEEVETAGTETYPMVVANDKKALLSMLNRLLSKAPFKKVSDTKWMSKRMNKAYSQYIVALQQAISTLQEMD